MFDKKISERNFDKASVFERKIMLKIICSNFCFLLQFYETIFLKIAEKFSKRTFGAAKSTFSEASARKGCNNTLNFYTYINSTPKFSQNKGT